MQIRSSVECFSSRQRAPRFIFDRHNQIPLISFDAYHPVVIRLLPVLFPSPPTACSIRQNHNIRMWPTTSRVPVRHREGSNTSMISTKLKSLRTPIEIEIRGIVNFILKRYSINEFYAKFNFVLELLYLLNLLLPSAIPASNHHRCRVIITHHSLVCSIINPVPWLPPRAARNCHFIRAEFNFNFPNFQALFS